MKFMLALGALACAASAFGQVLPRTAKEQILLVPQKSAFSLSLYRSSRLCAGMRECDETWDTNAPGLGMSPCATDPLSCQLAVEAHHASAAPFGGLKISGTIGRLTLSVGRHGDNPLLAHSPVLEGAYRLSAEDQAYVGVVRHTDQSGSHHPMLFLLWKKQL